ncbi:hypothetical protein ACFQY0_16700 [Haloferula chungangensis]|uniref:Uncharacterized protein n=1 Tax=Haloferula chungangensis TaxID=1048331 RepID=A0ABW2LCW6_9BACT
MKFTNRCLRALARLIPTVIILGVVYVAAYFLLMEKGTAINRTTLIPEYSSISRLGKDERKIGPLSIQVTFSSWLNPIFEPLDRVFR